MSRDRLFVYRHAFRRAGRRSHCIGPGSRAGRYTIGNSDSGSGRLAFLTLAKDCSGWRRYRSWLVMVPVVVVPVLLGACMVTPVIHGAQLAQPVPESARATGVFREKLDELPRFRDRSTVAHICRG